MSTEKLPEWALAKAKAVFDKIPGAIAEEYSIKHIAFALVETRNKAHEAGWNEASISIAKDCGDSNVENPAIDMFEMMTVSADFVQIRKECDELKGRLENLQVGSNSHLNLLREQLQNAHEELHKWHQHFESPSHAADTKRYLENACVKFLASEAHRAQLVEALKQVVDYLCKGSPVKNGSIFIRGSEADKLLQAIDSCHPILSRALASQPPNEVQAVLESVSGKLQEFIDADGFDLGQVRDAQQLLRKLLGRGEA
jgi:hypothetical protein